MPKMDFKVEKLLCKSFKFNFYVGTMKNDVVDRSPMTQKMLLGLLVISKKNFNPYLTIFVCQKKINKTRYYAKNDKKLEFWI